MITKKPYYLSKNRTSFLLFVSLFFSTYLNSQSLEYKSLDWEEKVSISDISPAKKTILFKQEYIEFNYEDENLVEYYFKHQKEYLVSDKDIEESNMRFITYANQSELVFAKARVIKPNKEIVLLDQSKILDAVNEQTGEKSKYFAFEGVEKGSIIEYIFVVKKAPGFYGRTIQFQESDSISAYEFSLLAPLNLLFKFKTLNDTTKAIYDTASKSKNKWTLSAKNIPALKEEPFAPLNLLYKQFVFKLDKNIGMGLSDISSYGNASQNIYKNIHANIGKADEKAIDKFVKEINLPKDAAIDEKIWKIENYLKENIRINDDDASLSESPAEINTVKQTSEFGIIKVMAAIFEKIGIEYNVVLTCDRTISKFDKEFESFKNITDYLIYFPSTQKFLDPGEYAYRYGLVPSQFTDNDGLFIKETILGEFKTGVGKVKYIPPSAYNETYSNLDIKVNITNDFADANIVMNDATFGHYAVFTQPYLKLLDESELKKYIENNLKNQMPALEIIDWKIINSEPEACGKLPLIISSNSRNNGLIEKAGNKFLFKVGELIGPQMELYSQEERKLPLYSNYKRTYNRKIEILIPEGFKVKNLDDLIMYSVSEKDGKKLLLFDSKYTLENNKIIVDIQEFYDQLYFNKIEYQKYREVVNRASDFNKIILVFENISAE